MRIVFLFFGLLLSTSVFAQIEFSYFQEEIDALKNDRKVEKYWRSLYAFDRDNTSLKIPMDSVTVLNRLKAAYLVEKYGFPDPKKVGKKAAFTLLSIHAHTRFSDISSRCFFQLLEGKEKNTWPTAYPNFAMNNRLFWYNGKEIALQQEFDLALRILEEKPEAGLDMDQLCAMASNFLRMERSKKRKVLGEWVMGSQMEKWVLQLIQFENQYYLKKGDFYFLLKKGEGNVFHFYTVLDKTSLFIFENGELILRDMFNREMAVYPIKS
ncbi:MAG: hypothetical protein WC044_14030 [Crocinitomicaceae bacterium]